MSSEAPLTPTPVPATTESAPPVVAEARSRVTASGTQFSLRLKALRQQWQRQAPEWLTLLIYGVVLALGVAALNALDYAFRARMYPGEIYMGMLALGFLALGVWAGMRLVHRKTAPEQAAEPGNAAAQASLGISGRELEVLKALAEGLANKEIARRLDISPNTVKTHVSRLFEKLDAGNRTEAVGRARSLGILL